MWDVGATLAKQKLQQTRGAGAETVAPGTSVDWRVQVLAQVQSRWQGLSLQEVATRKQPPPPRKRYVNTLAPKLLNLPSLCIVALMLSSVFAPSSSDVAKLGELSVLAAAWLFSLLVHGQLQKRSAKGLHKLQQARQHKVKVRRLNAHGQSVVERVLPDALVLGDILLLESGLLLPGDGLLLESDGLRVDEAILTGEATLVNKAATPIASVTDLSDARDSQQVFAGTRIKTGTGVAIITALGEASAMGQIERLASRQEAKPKASLKNQAAELGGEAPELQALNQSVTLLAMLLVALTLGLHSWQGTALLNVMQLWPGADGS
jgi:magnesium-transporting ATPase (P-type)